MRSLWQLVRSLEPILLVGLVSLTRIGAAFAVAAIIARLGASDFGIVSQISAVTAIFASFAGGAVTNGLIAKVSGADDRAGSTEWLAASYVIAFAASALLAVAAVICSAYSTKILGRDNLALCFFGIAITQIIVGAGQNTISYTSGTGQTRLFAVINISSYLTWTALSILGTAWLGFEGAAATSVLMPACAGTFGLLLNRSAVRGALYNIALAGKRKLGYLITTSMLMLPSIIVLPLAITIVRADYGAHFGWENVGLWQASLRVSDAYMSFFATAVIFLYLPALTAASGTRQITVRWAFILLSIFALGALVLFTLRKPIFEIAFSQQFSASTDYVAPQLVGDFGKLLSWIIIYRHIALGHRWTLSAGEVLQALCYVAFYYIIVPQYPQLGPVYAHVVSSWVLVSVLIITTRFKLGRA